MKLIVGLGNPEKSYDGTRHNIGFAIVDAYGEKQGLKWQKKSKFKALVAELRTGSHPVLLIKPTTYYNLVGESVHAVADFYKITPENILVIHDDHVLPFGTLRTRGQGSDAGNNGIKSINAHMGPNTRRLRIGTDSEHRKNTGDTSHVLGAFTAKERSKLPQLYHQIFEVIDGFLTDDFSITTKRPASDQ